MTGDKWWDGDGLRLVAGPGPSGRQPSIVDARRAAVRSKVRGRIPAYTPEWTDTDPSDAGQALIELFAGQAEPVLQRLGRLPEKVLVEQLRIAGVAPFTATPAAATLQFTVTPPDGASVLVPAGFQVGASSATGQGGQIIFETQRDLWATPATLASVLTGTAGRLDPVNPARPFAPFGARPRPGDDLWLGLAGPVAPQPMLTVEVSVPPDGASPAPAAAGGDSAPPDLAPLLGWDVLDGNRLLRVEVVRDTSDGLLRSGTIELRLPASWRTGRPRATRPAPELRWLRLSLIHGAYAVPPRLAALRLNAVAAVAVRTVRDEALLPITGGPVDGRTRMRLVNTPIVRGTVHIEVDDELAATAAAAPEWQEVPSLAGRTGDARVFTVDYSSGEVTFGDGRQGAKVPPGFRNVRARSYRVGGGSAGRVAAGAINATVTSLPHVTGVTNAEPASGGEDPEPAPETMRHGAARLRAGGRAVTAADYAQLALRTPGTMVARAHGVAGVDPSRGGVPAPGVAAVFVVPVRPDDGNPPIPDAATLVVVADHLAETAAPAGIRVVAAAPEFQQIRIEARLAVDPRLDRAQVFQDAGDALLRFLHPVVGGEDENGWPLGAALPYVALVRCLLDVPGVRAAPALRCKVDGRPVPPCTDVPLRPYALPWAERPVLIPVVAP